MATFIFENMTQAQADAITGADIIAVSTTTVGARTVGVALSNQVGTDVITLTVGTKSLTFNAANLSTISDAGNIVFNDSSSIVLGTTGADATLTGTTAPNTVYLFAGNDGFTSTGTNSEDFIYGMGGNDTITGGSTASHLYGFNAAGGTDGTDSLTGGAAGDYLQGNSGNDTLDGGAGSDRVLGGAGNDVVVASAGNDTINGNAGTDTLDGGTEDDNVRGGQGGDSVTGGAGNDFVFGDLGADTVGGGTGIDQASGGGGNDVFYFASGDVTTGTTVSSVTFYDTVLDYVDGEDEFRITAGGSTFGDAASSAELNIGAAGATFTTVSAATVYAQQLLDANTATNDVSIVKVGSDTYFFWDSTGVNGAAIDSIVKVAGITDTSLFTQADFGYQEIAAEIGPDMLIIGPDMLIEV